MIHTFRIVSRSLRGTHSDLMEQVRIIAAIHFNECPVHFDDFESIEIDYTVEENKDGSFTRVTNAVIEYDDDPWDDNEEDEDWDDGLSGAMVPVNPSPISPVEAASLDIPATPFLTIKLASDAALVSA